jgi:cysteine desulfurase family protein (TIGR01976 family)
MLPKVGPSMNAASPRTYALASNAEIRAQIPALNGDEVALDGAAGTQVPEAVIAAVAEAMRSAMSNVGGAFAASRVSTETVSEARAAVADLIGGVADGVVLGPSMTALTFRIANALAKSWGRGDEIVVTSLDHDANIRPWRIAAERAGATVKVAEFDHESGELPVSAVEAVLSERTRLVAVTAASNAIGTQPDVAAISERAHDARALTYVDGVHATPHMPTDVRAIGADFYACSSYKFCGPHAGAVVADPGLLDSLRPDKLIPSPSRVPHRFERGTPPFELLAGVRAAIDWLADLTDAQGSRRERLVASLAAIERSLEPLLAQMVEGLAAIDGVRILGAPRRRTPTVSFTVEGKRPEAVVEALAARRIAVWAGDNYAYELMRRFGLDESGGAIRASIVLYNNADEVARFLEAVEEIAAAR